MFGAILSIMIRRMRLKRTQNDFRVSEILDDDSLLGDGPFAVYRITKRGLTTFEAADLLAQAAGVERTAVAYAGLKDKDGITSQVMTVEGGKPVTFRDKAMTIRPLGRATRAIASTDSKGNSFEIFVRDLESDDMRRIRVNLNQVRKMGLPNYFDDQRFGCLRHGQGFVVRSLLRGDFQAALRALLAAPSRYGSEQVEKYKHGMQKRWGHWEELSEYTRNRRGSTVFEHLKNNPEDFRGALERGIATRERTIHLFAFQSYLWNRAVAIKIQEVVDEQDLAWLPCDAGSLPVYHGMATSMYKELKDFQLPLLGPDMELDEETERLYKKVFRHEGLPMSAFLELDINGFRPQAEMRPVLVDPEFLRAAPAEQDEIYRRRQKMRVRFSLPRGHYATLVCKRLLMPTDKNYMALRIWVARHPLDWPNDAGEVPANPDYNDRRHYSERGREHGYRSPGAPDRFSPDAGDRGGRPHFVRPVGNDRGDRGGRPHFVRPVNNDRDDRGGFNRGGRDDNRGAWQGNRDDNRGGWQGNRDDNRGSGGDNYRGNRDDNRGDNRGAWQGNRDDNRGGGGDNYRGNRDDNRGGWQGNRDDNRGGGGDNYRGNRDDNRGAWQGNRDDNRGGGDSRGAWGGNRDQREDRRPPRDDNRPAPRDQRPSSDEPRPPREQSPRDVQEPTPDTSNTPEEALPADSPWAKAKRVKNDNE